MRRSSGSWRVRMRVSSGSRHLDPATVTCHEDGLGAVDGADLAVDVVEVGADRRDREVHLGRYLLVDHALGEMAEDIELTAGERAGLADPGSLVGRQGQLVEQV